MRIAKATRLGQPFQAKTSRVIGALHNFVIRGDEVSAPDSGPVASLEFKIAEISPMLGVIKL